MEKKNQKIAVYHKFGDRMTRSRKSKGIHAALNLYHIIIIYGTACT